MDYVRIKEVLHRKGLSQKWLQEQLGITYAAVNAIVNNKNDPSLKRLHEIAGLLNVDVCELLAQSKYEAPPTPERIMQLAGELLAGQTAMGGEPVTKDADEPGTDVK